MKLGSLRKPFALLFVLLSFTLASCTSPVNSTLPASANPTSDSVLSSDNASSSVGTSSAASSAGPISSSSNPPISSSPIPDGYWAGVDVSGNTIGNSFRAALQSIMIKKGTATGSNSYKALNSILAKSDRHPNGGVCAFYRNDEVSSGWNKEHVWPNSRGAGESAGYAGTDPQVIRPTNSSDNSSRGNYMYAERSDPSAKATAATGWDPAAFGYVGARGEAARIIFYAATRYYNLSTAGAGGTSHGSAPLELSITLDGSADNHLMGKLDDLLRWNARYPVTRAEKFRNDYLAGESYARNPFIDHPDWANMIWDNSGIRSSHYTPSSSSYSESSSSAPTTKAYQLITSADDLVVGSSYVLASETSSSVYALAPMVQAQYFLGAIPAFVDQEGMVQVDQSFATLTLGGTAGAYTFKESKMGYLSGSINDIHYNLGFTSALSDTTSWSISFATTGAATLRSAKLVYAAFDPSYKDYTGSQTATTLALFKEVTA
jgi:endonuclease I